MFNYPVFLGSLRDEDIIEALGNSDDSDIAYFNDPDDEELLFDPVVFDNLNELGLEENPVEDQRNEQTQDVPVLENSCSAPSVNNKRKRSASVQQRPSRLGSRPRRWKVTTFDDKEHSYPNRLINLLRSPAEYMKEYFDGNFYETVGVCTNVYHLRKTGNEMKTTKREIQKLFGIHILMGCIPYPRLPMYWRNGISMDKITSKMSRDRFLQLRNALHVVSTDTAPSEQRTNPLWKVQLTMDQVRNGCYKQERLPGYYSIDEQMIPFTGRCPLRQMVKNNVWEYSSWPWDFSRVTFVQKHSTRQLSLPSPTFYHNTFNLGTTKAQFT